MEVKDIRILAKRGELELALRACNELLVDPNADRLNVLRTRAYAYAINNEIVQALNDRREVTNDPEATIADFFLAADNAIELESFDFACECLFQVLRLGKSADNSNFEAATHFLLAYCRMRMNRFSEAILDLQRATELDPGIAMPIPGESGIANGSDLKIEIERRRGIGST